VYDERMAFDAGSVIAKIKADITEFQSGLNKAKDAAQTMADKVKNGVDSMNGKIKDMTPQLQKASLAFGAIGAAGVLMLRDWTGAASGAQVSMAKFNATLKTMGKEGLAAKDALLAAAAGAVQMGFDDEDAAVALGTFFQRTKDVTESTKLLGLAQDLARAKSIDLATASTLVGQVLSGNGKVLKAYDIDIKETATPLEALGQLHEKVGGQAAAFMDTFAGKTEAAANRIGNMKERLGDALIPILEQLMVIGERVLAWFESLSPATISIIAKVVLFGTAAALLIAPLLLLVTFIPALVAGFTAIGAAISFIGAPILALIALAGLLFLAWQTNFLGIQDKTAAVFQFIRDAITVFKFWWESDWMAIQTIVTTAFDFIVAYFTIWWETLKMLFQVGVALLRGDWQGAWTAIKDWAISVFTIIGTWGQKFWDGLKLIFTSGSTIISDVWKGMMDGMKGITSGVWDGIKNVFTDAINWIINKMNSFLGSLRPVAGVLGKAIGIRNLDIPSIPNLAQGGIVTRPTLAMIGEGREPEAVVPLSKMSGMGGVHIHLHDSIISSVEAATELLDAAVTRVQPRLGL